MDPSKRAQCIFPLTEQRQVVAPSWNYLAHIHGWCGPFKVSSPYPTPRVTTPHKLGEREILLLTRELLFLGLEMSDLKGHTDHGSWIRSRSARLGLKLEVRLLEITGKSLPNKEECLSQGEKGQTPKELWTTGWLHTCRLPKGCTMAEAGDKGEEKGGERLLEPEDPHYLLLFIFWAVPEALMLVVLWR